MAEQIHGHTPPAADVEAILADPAGACPDCVRIVVERLHATLTEDPDRAQLLHELDVQRAAMATMLADERQMQAAHDRTRAERDDYRARLVATDRAYAEQAARADAAERERDQMAKRIEQGRQAAVVYAERIAEVEAERDRLAEQVKRAKAAHATTCGVARGLVTAPGVYCSVCDALDGTEAGS